MSQEKDVRAASPHPTHDHDWKRAPDWEIEEGDEAYECFPCRLVTMRRRSAKLAWPSPPAVAERTDEPA